MDSKNLVKEGSYHSAPISVDEMWAWLEKYAAITRFLESTMVTRRFLTLSSRWSRSPMRRVFFKDYICDVGQYLADADAAGKKVLFEAQLGALRDIDFGIYPYTSSRALRALPTQPLILLVKQMQSTGRPASAWARKAVSKSSREGKEIAVRDFYQFMVDNPAAYPKTSLPSLEDFETAFRAHAEAGRPVLTVQRDIEGDDLNIQCCGRLRGQVAGAVRDDIKHSHASFSMRRVLWRGSDVVVEYLPGWHCDITAARKWEDLPQEARDEVVQITHREEDLVGDLFRFQPGHGFVQRTACIPHGHKLTTASA